MRLALAEDLLVFDLAELVDRVETELKTSVQTVVKREDEQKFARLTSQNAMFVEDAARLIGAFLDTQTQYSDFWVRVDHYESLHAHDATAIVSKKRHSGLI